MPISPSLRQSFEELIYKISSQYHEKVYGSELIWNFIAEREEKVRMEEREKLAQDIEKAKVMEAIFPGQSQEKLSMKVWFNEILEGLKSNLLTPPSTPNQTEV